MTSGSWNVSPYLEIYDFVYLSIAGQEATLSDVVDNPWILLLLFDNESLTRVEKAQGSDGSQMGHLQTLTDRFCNFYEHHYLVHRIIMTITPLDIVYEKGSIVLPSMYYYIIMHEYLLPFSS